MTLIERLEKAEEGSRELDGLIYGVEHSLALNGCTFMLEIHGRETFQFQHPTLRHPNGPAALYVTGYDVAPVTTSFDAALALAERVLPDLYMWNVEFDDEPTSTPASARVYAKTDGRGDARTPALALCLAVLRATQGAT